MDNKNGGYSHFMIILTEVYLKSDYLNECHPSYMLCYMHGS